MAKKKATKPEKRVPHIPEVLTFNPARRCVRCERLTNLAYLLDSSHHFWPVCPWHGYYEALAGKSFTREQREQQEAAACRFVVAHFQNKGEAHVLARIRAELVPGLEKGRPQPEKDWLYRKGTYDPHEDFEAWIVQYDRKGLHKRGYVVWDHEWREYFWIPDPKIERSSSPTESASPDE